MKQGKSLMELAAAVQENADAKKDYIADTRKLAIVPKVNPEQPEKIQTKLAIEGQGEFDVTNHTHGQISSHLKIPKVYYDRMLNESPALLANNVNHWFNESPSNRMVRTLHNNARAFLSNRYRVLDHDTILESVLPTIAECEMQLISCDVTSTRLYIKCLFPRIMGEVTVGDVVQSGMMLSNSEIGLGAVNVMPIIYRLSCKNGAISADYGLKKYHVGRIAQGEGQGAFELYRDETLIADDRAFMLKLQDVVRATVDQAKFDDQVYRLKQATEDRIEGDVVKSVEVVQKRFGLNEVEKAGVLSHLISGGDLSKYGLMNALTRTSQDIDDYDRATEMERMGGQVIELPKSDWQTISVAKAA